MSHNDPITVLRNHVIATDGQMASPCAKAVEIERALEREGYTVVATEAVGVLAAIVSQGCVSDWQLQSILCRLGLAKIVPFDPEKHDAGGAEIDPGGDFLEYSDAMKHVLRRARPHLRGALN